MNKDTLYVKRKRPTDMLLLAAIYISATLAVALLLGIILYVFVKGIPRFEREQKLTRDYYVQLYEKNEKTRARQHRNDGYHLPETI